MSNLPNDVVKFSIILALSGAALFSSNLVLAQAQDRTRDRAAPPATSPTSKPPVAACAQALTEAEGSTLAKAQAAAQICTQTLGPTHPDTLTALHRLGNALEGDGEAAAALTLRRKVLQDRRAVLGAAHRDALSALGNLARSLGENAQYAEAITLLQNGVALAPMGSVDEKKLSIRLRVLLAELFLNSGQAKLGVPVAETAFKLAEPGFGVKSVATADVFAIMAQISQTLGHLSDAEDYAFSAITGYGTEYGKEHPQVLMVMSQLVEIYRLQGRREDAEAFASQTLRYGAKTFGERHPHTVSLTTQLTSALLAQGKYAQAVEVLDPLLQNLLSSRSEKEQVLVIPLLRLRAKLAFFLNEIEQALTMLDLAQEKVQVLKLQANFPEGVDEDRGGLLIKLGRYPEAIQVLEKRRAMLLALADSASKKSSLLDTEMDLAAAYGEAKQLDKAVPLAEAVMLAKRKALGLANDSTLITIKNLALVILQTDAQFSQRPYLLPSLAEDYLVGAEGLRNRYATSALDRQRLLAEHLIQYRFFAWQLGQRSETSNSETDRFMGFQLVEMTKGRTLWDGLIRSRAIENSGLPPAKIQEMRAKLAAIQDDEQRATVLESIVRTPEREQALRALRTNLSLDRGILSQLEDDLRKEYPRFAQMQVFSVPNPRQEAPRLLKPDQVLVSYVLDFSERLSAWVLDQSGQARFVSLGEHPDLRDLIAQFRDLHSAERKPLVRTLGERSSEQKEEALRAALSAILIKPLQPYLKGRTLLTISPDSDLAMLPFDLLHLDGKSLGSQFDINIVHSWSVFAMLKERQKEYQQNPSPKGLLAVGNPTYQVSLTAVVAKADQPSAPLLRGASLVEPVLAASMVAQNRPAEALTLEREAELVRNLRWANLPGTGIEIQRVGELFPGPGNFTALTGPNASEAKLRELDLNGALAQHRYLLFSAHGVLASDPSLSSIVLSQETVTPEIDGYVTAKEIERLRLRSELVVLSACDTGVGTVTPGDGLLGLPYSFFVAGNQNTLVTLWPVADEATAEFMTRFFKRLTQGEGQISALTQVKREFSNHPQYRHPRYWAGFILYGV